IVPEVCRFVHSARRARLGWRHAGGLPDAAPRGRAPRRRRAARRALRLRVPPRAPRARRGLRRRAGPLRPRDARARLGDRAGDAGTRLRGHPAARVGRARRRARLARPEPRRRPPLGRARPRRGHAREAVEGLLAHTGWPAVREGVIAGNEAGLALARALGFRPLGRRTQTLSGGPTTVLVLERR